MLSDLQLVVSSFNCEANSFLGRGAETALAVPSSGMKWTMMRHGNRVKHLGRPADQRKALIRSLVTEVIRHGAIRTTKVQTHAFTESLWLALPSALNVG